MHFTMTGTDCLMVDYGGVPTQRICASRTTRRAACPAAGYHRAGHHMGGCARHGSGANSAAAIGPDARFRQRLTAADHLFSFGGGIDRGSRRVVSSSAHRRTISRSHGANIKLGGGDMTVETSDHQRAEGLGEPWTVGHHVCPADRRGVGPHVSGDDGCH